MTKSIIIDPGLKTATGHHLSLSRELSKAANSMGHNSIWLGHKDLDTRLVPDFVHFVPTFSSTIYEPQMGILGRTLRPLVGERRFLRTTLRERPWEFQLRQRLPLRLLDGDRCVELARALRSQNPDRGDHLIVHSADSQTVDMLSSWALQQQPHNLPGIHVRTCWSKSNMPFASYAGGYSQSILRLSSIAARVTFSAETSEGAHLLKKETGLAVRVCPHIVDECLFQLAGREVASKPLLVGWLGDPRVEKGAAILPQIIRTATTSAKPDQLRFLVQCAGRSSRKSREFENQLAEFGNSIEQLPAVVSQDAYLAALDRCDVILLPYDRKLYPPERGSAVAIEALLTGKPIVAMDKTFAAGLIEPDSGAVGSDAETLAAGLLDIVNDYEHFRNGALRARDRARKTYDRLTSYSQLIGLNSELATQ